MNLHHRYALPLKRSAVSSRGGMQTGLKKAAEIEPRTQVVQSTDKKLKRAFCDTFSDVIFTGECSVKIECYPHRSFRKVGQQHHNKGQPRHRCFVLFLFRRKSFNPSLTQLIHPFPYLDMN